MLLIKVPYRMEKIESASLEIKNQDVEFKFE